MPLSVGGAATDAILQVLAQREATKQKALALAHINLQDQLDQQRSQREQQGMIFEQGIKQQELQQRGEILKAGQAEKDRLQEDKDRTDFEKWAKENLTKGDIPTDPAVLAKMDKYGYTRTPVSQSLPTPPSGPLLRPAPQAGGVTITPPTPNGAPGSLPQPMSGLRLAPSTPVPKAYIGNVAEREAEKKQQLKQQLIADASDPVKMAEMKANPVLMQSRFDEAGMAIPAGLVVPKAEPAIIYVDALQKKMWDVNGNPTTTPPVGAHFVEVQHPPAAPGQNTQPQMIFGPDGKMHAVKFTGNSAQEIPLPAGLEGGTKTNPITGQMKNRQVGAQQVRDAIPTVEALIVEADRRGLLGPAMGRVSDFLAKDVGSTGNDANDELLGQLRLELSGVRSGFAYAHGGARGSNYQMAKALEKNLDESKMDRSGLHGGLLGIDDFLAHYSADPRIALEEAAKAAATPPPAAKPKIDFDKILQGVIKK